MQGAGWRSGTAIASLQAVGQPAGTALAMAHYVPLRRPAGQQAGTTFAPTRAPVHYSAAAPPRRQADLSTGAQRYNAVAKRAYVLSRPYATLWHNGADDRLYVFVRRTCNYVREAGEASGFLA